MSDCTQWTTNERLRWAIVSFWAAALLTFIVPGQTATIAPSTLYTVSNEVIYTNQSTGQSTWQVSDLCTPFAPVCTCEMATSLCQGLLFDGDTASANNGSTDLHKFWAFNGSSNGSVKVIVSGNTAVAEIVLYFYNSPEELIGFPDIAITSPDADNLSFSFTDNDDLSQADSQVRSVTVFLAPNVIEFTIQFLFLSSNMIQYMLISEMELMTTGTSPTLDPVGFLNGTSSEVVLGADNPQPSVSLSCTVTNSGSFEWQWKHNDSPVDISRSKIWIADATRTSILVVDGLRYTDTGTYTCDVVYFSASTTTYSKNNVLILNFEIRALMAVVNGEEGQNAMLSCEMYGYLTDDIVWTKDGQLVQSGEKYNINTKFGNRLGQNGGETTTSSVISELGIRMLEQQDSGTYICTAAGTIEQSQVDLIIESPAVPVPITTTPADPSQSTLPEDSNPSSSPSSSFPVAVVVSVVVIVLLLGVILVVVVILVIYFKKRRMGKVGNISYGRYGNSVRDSIHEQLEVVNHSVSNGKDSKIDEAETELTYSMVVNTPPQIPPQNFVMDDLDLAKKSDHLRDDLERSGKQTTMPYKVSPIAGEQSPVPRKLSHTLAEVDLKSNPLYQTATVAMENLPIAEYSQVGPAESTYASVYADPDAVTPFGIYAEANKPDHSCPVYSEPAAVDFAHALYSEPNMVTSKDEPPQEIISAIYAEPIKGSQVRQVKELTENQIRILESLGTGQFGEVVLAETVGVSLKELGLSDFDDNKEISVQVAIKKVKEGSDERTRSSFEKEMKFMSQLDHVNVLRLLGIKSSDQPFMALEYMENGDLSQFLAKHKFTPNHPPSKSFTISSPILLSMAKQIASGMSYLATLNFIHRDLAIRNCLVGRNYEVKIADFGLSRKLYDSAYYRVKGKAKMPIRWMATECFYGKFSEKSDVWAYGVAVWEIYNIARDPPYKELSDREVIDDAIKGAGRSLLTRPEHCPQEVFDVIVKCCWPYPTKERATFAEIHAHLARLETPEL